MSYPAAAESFRAEVRTVLAQELPPGWAGIGAIAGRQDAERFAAHWREALYRRGLVGITWPPEHGGRGLSRLHQVVLMEELARAGAPCRGPLRAVRTDDPGAPNSSGSWLGAFLNARAGTIYAGTSEVQRNILAETVLGLPKEKRREEVGHG